MVICFLSEFLDIILSFEEKNVSIFVELMNDLGLKPKVPVDPSELANFEKRESWKNERNMKVFSFFNPNNEQEVVDVMIQDYINYDEALKNSKLMKDENISVPVVSIDDLIRLKEIFIGHVWFSILALLLGCIFLALGFIMLRDK